MILANGSPVEQGIENERRLKTKKKLETWGPADVWFLFELLHKGYLTNYEIDTIIKQVLGKWEALLWNIINSVSY
jgi:hypothetical protein